MTKKLITLALCLAMALCFCNTAMATACAKVMFGSNEGTIAWSENGEALATGTGEFYFKVITSTNPNEGIEVQLGTSENFDLKLTTAEVSGDWTATLSTNGEFTIGVDGNEPRYGIYAEECHLVLDNAKLNIYDQMDGIRVVDGTLTITNSTVSIDDFGGVGCNPSCAIHCSRDITITGSSVVAASKEANGIYTEGTLSIASSVVTASTKDDLEGGKVAAVYSSLNVNGLPMKAGESEASATDVTDYSGQKYLCVGTLEETYTATVFNLYPNRGTVTLSSYTDLHAGDTVTVTAMAQPGYKLGQILVCKTAVPTVWVPVQGDSFEMPDYDVTVYASFRVKSSGSTTTTTTTTTTTATGKVTSARTFDSGTALYGAMATLSVLGSGVILCKRRER